MSTVMFFGFPIFLVFLLFSGVYHDREKLFSDVYHNREESIARYEFVVKEVPCRRLCSTKKIMTVNGQYPGPTLFVQKGETIIVDVYNRGTENVTIHWHGVIQPRNPWSDGPEFITQCSIKPGGKFSQKLIFSIEEGTVWWHAHSNWFRATVHGAIVVYPKKGTTYPFPKPYAEEIIILGEWWKVELMQMFREIKRDRIDPIIADANTINGQPGDLYPCSKQGTYKLNVDPGKTYLLRIINAAMQDIMFFSIANHNFTVVGSDASYTKPFTSDLMTILPGQTIDVLLTTNQKPNRYYMGSKVYRNGFKMHNYTATAILQYNGNYTASSRPLLPKLPKSQTPTALFDFIGRFKSLADKDHPIDVPLKVDKHLTFVVSMNTVPCPENQICLGGDDGQLTATSINNISFQFPKTMNILEAYYFHVNGVFGTNFPSFPQGSLNYTAWELPHSLEAPKRGTEVTVLEYNTTVELVFQNTNLVKPDEHSIHLHGHSFYIVGWGPEIFDKEKDPLKYNLVDPPFRNTVIVQQGGWVAIRFKANNPGAWLMHCHLERHAMTGMDTVFIVKNGTRPEEQMLPRPSDMPPC